MAGPADTNTYSNNLNSMLSLCEKKNTQVKLSKVEGPSTSLMFLGIHPNTSTMEASITPDRKEALLQYLNSLNSDITVNVRRAQLFLIGKILFCCKVVLAGRIFLRRLIDQSTIVSKLHCHLPLFVDAKLHLQWWLDFWSGKSLNQLASQVN